MVGERRVFAIGQIGLFVRLGFEAVTLRFGVAVVIDEAHARSERVLSDGGSSCRVIVETPGEGQDAEEEDDGA